LVPRPLDKGPRSWENEKKPPISHPNPKGKKLGHLEHM